tara:strand:+ start:11691 stop:12323 length:633 start_codon:yes stop_codon:yes gene_type:complete
MVKLIVIHDISINKNIYESIMDTTILMDYNKLEYYLDFNGDTTSTNYIDLLIKFIIDNKISNGVIAIHDIAKRKVTAQYILNKLPSFNFITFVHPTCVIGKNTKIGIGSIIMPEVIINTYSVVKDFCIINTNTSVDHDSIINNYSNICSGVILGGNLQLGEESELELGVCILENISIGARTTIKYGSLVTRDIGSDIIASGIPAKKISLD